MSGELSMEIELLIANHEFELSNELTHQPLQGEIDYEGDLRTIDKWDEINNGHHNEKRNGERYPLRSWIRLAYVSVSYLDNKKFPQLVLINGFSRDISSKGASILCPEKVFPLKCHDRAETVRTSHCLSVSDHVSLGIQRTEGNWITMKSEVRSIRKTPSGLNRIGLKFCRSAESTGEL